MAQILSIYGLVASVIMSNGIKEKMPIHTGFLQLGAGIAVGLCGMAAGFAIGIVGDAGGKLASFTLDTESNDSQSEPARSSRASMSAWFSSSSLQRSWACTASLSPFSCSPAPRWMLPSADTKTRHHAPGRAS